MAVSRTPTPSASLTMRVDVDLGPDVSLGAGVPRGAGGGPFVRISPDGERFVFLANGRLMTTRLSEGVSVSIAGTEGASYFFFSPDGQAIGFVAGGKLKRVGLDGGSVSTICESLPVVRGGAWSNDVIVLGGTGLTGGLMRVAAGGGTVEPLLPVAAGEFTQRWPQFLPGGKALLFTSHGYPGRFDHARIDVLSLADGRRKTLVEGGTFGMFIARSPAQGYLIFVRSGTVHAVAFDPIRLALLGQPFPVLENIAYDHDFGSASIDASATGSLVYRNRTDTRLTVLEAFSAERPLPLEPGSYSGVTLSPDGGRIAFMSNEEIWVYDLTRDVRTRVTNGLIPVWTPDGRFLVFSTLENVWWIRADGGSAPQPLLRPKASVWRLPSSMHQEAAAPRLAFQEFAIGGRDAWDLWSVPIRVDPGSLNASEPELFFGTGADERHLSLSPDGRWASYTSFDAGTPATYVRTFPDDGRRWKVSEGGGYRAQWSTARPELFFHDGRVITSAPYAIASGAFLLGKPRVWSPQLLDSTSPTAPFSVSLDGRRVVAIVPDLKSEERFRHVITLWTHAVDQFQASLDQGRQSEKR
jgi:serine/threonine-protein kinase